MLKPGKQARALITNIQSPLKQVVGSISSGAIGFRDFFVLWKVWREIQKLPEFSEKDKARYPNVRILLDTLEDIFAHFRGPFSRSYASVFRGIAKYPIFKLANDGFYMNLFHLFLLGLLSRGWLFPHHLNLPSRRIWHSIPPNTETRLKGVIRPLLDSYGMREDSIEECIQRILVGVKKEVAVWKNNPAGADQEAEKEAVRNHVAFFKNHRVRVN